MAYDDQHGHDDTKQDDRGSGGGARHRNKDSPGSEAPLKIDMDWSGRTLAGEASQRAAKMATKIDLVKSHEIWLLAQRGNHDLANFLDPNFPAKKKIPEPSDAEVLGMMGVKF